MVKKKGAKRGALLTGLLPPRRPQESRAMGAAPRWRRRAPLLSPGILRRQQLVAALEMSLQAAFWGRESPAHSAQRLLRANCNCNFNKVVKTFPPFSRHPALRGRQGWHLGRPSGAGGPSFPRGFGETVGASCPKRTRNPA